MFFVLLAFDFGFGKCFPFIEIECRDRTLFPTNENQDTYPSTYVVECGTNEELNLDLSDRLRHRSIKLKNAFLLRGADVILYYRHQV